MLAGGLRYTEPDEKLLKSDFRTFDIDDGHQLRYFDQKRMGMVYYLEGSQIGEVPRIGEQGPDILNCQMSFQIPPSTMITSFHVAEVECAGRVRLPGKQRADDHAQATEN